MRFRGSSGAIEDPGDMHTFIRVQAPTITHSASGAATTWADVSAVAEGTAQLTTALTGANNDLVYTAKTAGASGNDISIEYVLDAGAMPPVVYVSDSAIRITCVSGTTAATVKSQIDGSPTASLLVSIANATGNDGTGAITAMAATNLTGGADEYDPGMIVAQWVDAHGTQGMAADAIQAGETATVSWWYREDIDSLITPACRILHCVDSSAWEILSAENIRRLNLWMTCRIRRMRAG